MRSTRGFFKSYCPAQHRVLSGPEGVLFAEYYLDGGDEREFDTDDFDPRTQSVSRFAFGDMASFFPQLTFVEQDSNMRPRERWIAFLGWFSPRPRLAPNRNSLRVRPA